KTVRFIGRLQDLTREQLELLARRWRIQPGASRALLQAVAKNRQAKSEEAVALAALGMIPNHVTGDEGWSAVRTVVHGGRVLGALGDLTALEITELRVLDRRKLVASVTREGSLEPAGVVRSMLAAIELTRQLDMFSRCRVFAAVERAGFAIESHSRLNLQEVRKMLAPFEASINFEELNGGGFAHKVAGLGSSDWQRIAAAAPEANEEAVA